MNKQVINITLELTVGAVSKKGNSYNMAKVKTDNEALNRSLKGIFLDDLQLQSLLNTVKK